MPALLEVSLARAAVAGVGVPEEHILACEQNWGLEIPSAYRSFLECMGADAGHFSPFPNQEWNFYELLRDPPEDYRPQEFFRVAVDIDDSLITWSEVYLDMATVRPDGDCDVVQVEWLSDPASSRSLVPRVTFLERLLGVVWMALDGPRFSYDRFVLADGGELESIHEVLRRTGFSLALPPETREAVWCSLEGSPATAHSSGGPIASVSLRF